MPTLEQIIYTLSQIKVSGEDDLSRMLGCIKALRTLAAEDAKKLGGD